jgi:hypothetical protein
MPLHFYQSVNQANTALAIAVLTFDVLAQFEPGFVAFRQKTGIRISEYDDSKLSRSQLALLVVSIEERCHKIDAEGIRSLNDLRRALAASSSDTFFIGVGE